MYKFMMALLFISIPMMVIGVYLVFNNGYPTEWDAVDKVGLAAQFQANALVRKILPGYSLIFGGGLTMLASVIYLKRNSQ